MDSDRKKGSTNSSKTGVVMGSVWESRMKGSLKVFNGDDKNQEIEKPIEKNNSTETSGEIVKKEKVVLRSKQSSNGVGGGGKRKTWKSDCNFEGTEKIPVQIPKARSENKKVLGELSKELTVSNDGNGIKKSPVQMKKGRQEWSKEQSVSVDGIERSPVQRTIKTRSLSRKESTSSDLVTNSSTELKKVKPLSIKGNRISDESNNEVEEITGENRGDNEIAESRSQCSQSLEELDVACEENLMTDDDFVKNTQDCEEDEDATMGENHEINEERAIVVVKEMEPISTINKKKSTDVEIEDKKIQHRNERPNPISRTIRKQTPPVVNHPRIISKQNEIPSQRVPKSNNRLQTFIDLIMWNDASKSALIFGFGTFSILSSSYTKDLNISFISVISYLGLIYLAAIFIFRSFIVRGVVEDNITDDEECVVGEEEAIWALKLFLPYVNEFLLKVKALFSGDPSTTMKLAVLLFVLARCGSSITIWKMAKLGTFWVRRFKDAWETCSQKKAVAFGVFTLVWNISSIVARVWAVFMLLVAFKYYQQSMMKDEVVEEEEPITRGNRSPWQEEQGRGKISVSAGSTKLRKRS